VFRIHDYELTESELTLLETGAIIAADGHITFPGQARATERRVFNLCEILLEWATAEEFGVQRIRLGESEPLTKARWWRKLQRNDFYRAVSSYRKRSIRACFPSEPVKFRVLGWRLLNVAFWSPRNSVRIAEAREAGISRVLVQR